MKDKEARERIHLLEKKFVVLDCPKCKHLTVGIPRGNIFQGDVWMWKPATVCSSCGKLFVLKEKLVMADDSATASTSSTTI